MIEPQAVYMVEDAPKDHPARLTHWQYTEIGDMLKLFADAGIPAMTRGAILSAALRCLRWYIQATQAQGWTLERVWRDVNGGKE